MTGYADWPDKGPVTNGRRVTIMAAHTTLEVSETVEIQHVYEVVEPGGTLYVMGPKPVYGERLDGRPATPEPPPGEDPFAPGLYDGRVVASPGVDTNFETTSYVFGAPGTHEVCWTAGGLTSNTLRLEVVGATSS